MQVRVGDEVQIIEGKDEGLFGVVEEIEQRGQNPQDFRLIIRCTPSRYQERISVIARNVMVITHPHRSCY